ncbi:MAG TPA: metallophosphoesterase [Mycobacteriales bacterium]|nr:metallophosphoesterase [Mycobacteriales bacterium]
MQVNIVSDVHGRADALTAAGAGADAFICLGDLLSFVDYADHSAGILGEIFGPEAVGEFVALRLEQRFGEASAYMRGLWAQLDVSHDVAVERAARAQYDRLFSALPRPAYVTYGNVDLPRLWPEAAGVRVLDGERIELGGRSFGFVGNGLPSPYRTPNEIPDAEYAANLAAVGAVDVLCCHIPPALPELTYDVVARRFERGSEALLETIRETQPRYAFFGHVHQPLQSRMRIGRTECVNVGHFRATGRPFVLQWDAPAAAGSASR